MSVTKEGHVMDFSFSAEEEAFRQDVRSFLSENLSERIRAGSRASPGVFFLLSLILVKNGNLFSLKRGG